MELSLSRVQGALATTTARATKTPLAINMNALFFFLNFFAFISTLLKWCSDSEKKLNLSLCVYVPQTTSQKEIQRCVRSGCKEKVAARAKFVVFHLLIGLVSFDVFVAAARSSLLPGFIDGQESEHVFGKNACHLFTRYKCHSRFGSLMNYFVSLETDIWVERKKKSDVSEKIYFSKKQAELNELRKNVLLKQLLLYILLYFWN